MKYAFLPQIAVLVMVGAMSAAPVSQATRPPSSAFGHAVKHVRQEAISAAEVDDPSRRKYRLCVALSAMGYVQTNISAARYGYLRDNDRTLPQGTEQCLVAGAGLCGNQVQAFIEILRALQVPARAIQVYYEEDGQRQGHVVAEVRWGGEWRMFDVTWGYVPLESPPYDIMSFAERRARPASVEWFNEGHPWTLKADFMNIDPFGYLDADDATILTDGSGIVRPYVKKHTEDIVEYDLLHLPAYIGWARQWSGNFGQVKMQIDVPDGFDQLNLKVAGETCRIGCIEIDGELYPIEEILCVPVDEGPLTLAIGPDDSDCYVVIDALSLQRVEPEQQ